MTWGKGAYNINERVTTVALNTRLGTSGNLGSAALLDGGAANGAATLDANGKVPIAQIPDSLTQSLTYNGLWDASTNTPTLSPTPPTAGNFYIVSVAGTQFSITWAVGDWIISNGSAWEKVPNPSPVTSVNGYTGAVVLSKSDVGLSLVDNVSAANLRARSTHTGTQLLSTISDAGTAAAVNMGTTDSTIRTNLQNDQRFVQLAGYTAFNPSGTYASLRAQATTFDDVGAPPTTRTFTASLGLTGGGDFSANRTISLGTPSTLTTTTTNSVTGTTHTHAITFPVFATRWPTWDEVTSKPAVESPLTFVATGAATVSRVSNTVTIGATNTTYSASTGLTLSGTAFSLTALSAGSTSGGALYYNGTSRSAGRLYGGTTSPTSSTRLNYDGYFYATRLYAVSSLKYKEIDRVDQNDESLTRVLAIGSKGVSVGRYKEDESGASNRWLIAEDVYDISPEVVQLADDGTPDALDYNQLIPDLYGAISAQQEIIKAQQEAINELRAAVAWLMEK